MMPINTSGLVYTVYIHTMPDGKKYVGLTIQKPNDRWVSGNGYMNNKRFFEDIQKVGWDNIDHEIFYQTIMREEADILEKALIRKYNTTNPEYGYNMSEDSYNSISPKDISTRLLILEKSIDLIDTKLQCIEDSIKRISDRICQDSKTEL